jgi:glycosyltransferase involved in cell wall biosynthesis
VLEPSRVAVVPNGIDDPCPKFARSGQHNDGPFRVLFLGLGSEEKGLFATANGVVEANRLVGAGAPAFTLTVAGAFPDAATRTRFNRLIAAHPAVIRHAGTVAGASKHALYANSSALCLPTYYPHEGQPLVLLEAMAYDLPIVTARWRAIPETVPAAGARFVEPGDVAALARALVELRSHPPTPGILRHEFLSRFSLPTHLDRLAAAISLLDANPQSAFNKVR